MAVPMRAGTAKVRTQAARWTLSTVDFMDAASLTLGNGISGTGSPRNLQSGSQPVNKKMARFRSVFG